MCQLGDGFKVGVNDLESRVQECIPPHIQYACLYWTAHLVENEPITDPEMQLLLEQFCTTKVLEWIEVLSLMNRLDLVIHALLRVYPWAKVSYTALRRRIATHARVTIGRRSRRWQQFWRTQTGLWEGSTSS